jgi:hypothetical protein
VIATPDATMELREERRFDLFVSAMIGVIAVMAAVLAVIQISTSQASTRADLQAARLASDLSARISISGQATGASFLAQQTALMLGIEAAGRSISAIDNGDEAALAVGAAADEAYRQLQAEMAATTATSGGAPLDAYIAGMIKATTADLEEELLEQNRQVDLANDQSARGQWASLGLSFLALAGVLTGLAAVLKEGRAGWTSFGMAGLMVAGAVGMAGLAVL